MIYLHWRTSRILWSAFDHNRIKEPVLPGCRKTELMTMAEQMLARVEEAPGIPDEWGGNHAAFLIRCVIMAREWR